MIHLITNRESEYNITELTSHDIHLSTAKEFNNWASLQQRIQLDTETNVTSRLIKRELYVVQIGDYDGNDQWIFDVPNLSGLKLQALKNCLNDRTKEKIIHNSMFEYSIIQKEFDIDIYKIRDTMLMSKILHTGLQMPKGFHSLAGCISRYLNIDIDKEAQTTFTGEPMTTTQILYAATDVVMLGKLHDALQIDIDRWELENTVKLECAVVRPLSDGLLKAFYLNTDKWKSLMQVKETEIEKIKEELYNFLKSEFLSDCERLNFIQAEDKYLFSWGSSKMKRNLLKIVYPNLPENCTALPAYKKFYQYLSDNEPDTDLSILHMLLNRNFSDIEKYFINNHKNELLGLGLYIPKGTVNINFNSPLQTLQLFQLIKPDLESVDKETIDKLKHPLAKLFRSYVKAQKLYSSYGQNFLDQVDEDGMLRIPDIQQILQTGRISMNLFQLLPSKGEYRNCFYPPKGYKVCGIDYNSQELVVVGTLSGEPKILEALHNGWDLHSICASMMFPKEWVACGEDPNPKGKPKSKEGDQLRSYSKRTTFGVMYGKSAIGLARDLDLYENTDDLMEQNQEEVIKTLELYSERYKNHCLENHSGKDNKISKKTFIKLLRSEGLFLPDLITGDDLVQRFKSAFPLLNNYLSDGAESAVIRSWIRTQDAFGRIRFFDKPENIKEEKAIFREALNLRIQAGSANMTKYACVLIKNYIEEHNLKDKVQFVLSIHDEIITFVKSEFAEEWMKIKMSLMEKAGEIILGNKLQKAEGNLSDVWVK